MRKGKELTAGGTIADRTKEHGEPKDIGELVKNMVEDWDIVLEAYKEEEDLTATYFQMYAMKGAIVLVNEFRKDLKTISDFLGKGEHAPVAEEVQPETPKAKSTPKGQVAPRGKLIAGPDAFPVKLTEDADIPVQPQPSADARLTTPSPIVDIQPNATQLRTPGKTQSDEIDPSTLIYRCRADHAFDEETAKTVNFHCPQCRMLLRRMEDYER